MEDVIIGLEKYQLKVFVPWKGRAIYMTTGLNGAIEYFSGPRGDWYVLAFLNKLKNQRVKEMPLLKTADGKLVATVEFADKADMDAFLASINTSN